MSRVGTGTCGRAVTPDGNGGVVRPGALTAVSPSGVGAAEMRSWSLAGEGGTGLVARTARRHCVAVVLAPLAGAGTTVSGAGADGRSALAVEQAGDRAVAEHLVDRPGQQRRDGQ